MKIKLFSLALVMAFSATIAMAQTKNKTAFAILGGVNFQNFNGKDVSGDKITNDIIIGYHGGLNVQIPIVPEFFFQPGLLFSTKGSKNSGTILTRKYNLSYIELPLNFVYKGLLGNGSVMVGFGPYAGYAIGGKLTTEDGGLSLKTDIDFQNVVEISDPLLATYFKALDIGGNIFAGYEMSNGIFLQLNAQMGMVKINPEDKRLSESKLSIKNTGFGLSVGYRF
jgi:hypothetical protein